jgi:exopolysaccharide biosynthesis polyprenyl glycosylphosphotransferase
MSRQPEAVRALSAQPSAIPAVSPRDEYFSSAAGGQLLEILEQRRRLIKRRGWLVRRALLVADVVALAVAFVIAEVTTAQGIPVNEGIAFAVTLPIWVVIAKIYRLYDRDEERTDHSTVDEFTGVFHLVTVGIWIVLAGSHITGVGDPGLAKVAMFWASAIALIATARAGARTLCRRHPSYMQNAVVVGAGVVGQMIARKLLQHPEYGIKLVGFLDGGAPVEMHPSVRDVPMLGTPDDLQDIVLLLDVERVIFAFSRNPDSEALPILGRLADLNVQIDIVPRLFEMMGSNVVVHSVESVPLLGLRPTRLPRSSLFLKRVMDLLVTTLGLALLAPFFALIAVAIKFDSSGPVFFRQARVGRDNRKFRIWKFRTMTVDADERKHEVVHLNKHLQNGGDPRMFKITNDPRVTRVGRFLRKFSIDELPQLLNVSVGQMSLVGPRPLIVDEHVHITEWAQRRVTLKPGITGLWQVLGRDEIPFEEMVKLDFLYVTNWSLWNDLLLVLRTPGVLIGSRAHGSR